MFKKIIIVIFSILFLCFNLWAGVDSVTATAPLLSSGGTNPNISITGLGTAANANAPIVPRAYPTGQIGVGGHNLPFLDQDNNFSCNYITVLGDDPATYPVILTVGGTPQAGDIVGFNWAGTKNGTSFNFNVTYTVQGGDSLTGIATGIVTALKSNADFLAIIGPGYAKNAFSAGPVLYWNNWWPLITTSTITAISTAHTTATKSGGSPALELSPYISVARHVPGRTPLAQDMIGAFIFVGDSTAAPLSQQYGDIIGKIIDPDPANLRGEISITTMQNSGLGIGRGLYTVGTGSGAGGDLGYGTLNVGIGLFVNNDPALIVHTLGDFKYAGINHGRFVIDNIADYNNEGFRLSDSNVSWNISVKNGKLVFQYYNGSTWVTKLTVGPNGIE